MGLSDLWNTRRITHKIKQATQGAEAAFDPTAQGSGPPNRHGLPKLPVGQHEVKKWPILDLGVHPTVAPERWALKVGGRVARPTTFSWSDFQALPQTRDTSDFHCVTRWSLMDVPWEGVRFRDLMDAVGLEPEGRYVYVRAFDDYTTNLPLEEALKADVLLVHRAFGEPLPREHGGPVRMITPQLYAWKGAKWIKEIEILEENRLGFWEQRGYSDTAHPWEDDRFS